MPLFKALLKFVGNKRWRDVAACCMRDDAFYIIYESFIGARGGVTAEEWRSLSCSRQIKKMIMFQRRNQKSLNRIKLHHFWCNVWVITATARRG